MNDCVFCNIVSGASKADILYTDEHLFVIRDIMPKAPIHLLIVPKEHILSINHLETKHRELIGDMFLVAKQMGEQYGISDKGYKLVFNVGHDGGQVIPHLHLHMLGGKSMQE